MTERVDPQTDDVLLHAVTQGNVDALMELYRRYAGQSLALALRYGLPDPVQAVEDAYLVVFRSAHRFSRCSLPAAVWILGMMQRHCRTLAPSAAGSQPRQYPH